MKPAETVRGMERQYGKSWVNRSKITQWIRRFKHIRKSACDVGCVRKSSTSKAEDNIQENRRITSGESARESNIRHRSACRSKKD